MDDSFTYDDQRSDSYRGFDSSSVSDRNPVLVNSNSGFDQFRTQVNALENNDISLRQWLDNPEREVDSIECLHIFSQIVGVVNLAHSQGVVVHNARPSCFVMSSFNRVSFIESASCSDSGSGSDSDAKTEEYKGLPHEVDQESNVDQPGEKEDLFPMKRILLMETNWYNSPEELTGVPSTHASDVYRLGILIFELFYKFISAEEKSVTMANLRHRVLPPQLLIKWPKVALFCLWLLHPDPTSRPKMVKVLQSEFLNEPRDDIDKRESAIELKEKIEEQELLLEFLLLVQQRKNRSAKNLQDTFSLLSSDIEEVKELQTGLKGNVGSNPNIGDSSLLPLLRDNEDSDMAGSRKRFKSGFEVHNVEDFDGHEDGDQGRVRTNIRLMRNFKKVESAYYMTRRRAVKPTVEPLISPFTMSSDLSLRERYKGGKQSGWIHSFLEGLCRYLSFNKLEVKADLKQEDLLNSSNLVCSLSFDRDGDFFATAGVNKKIKVFEYETIVKEDRDIHYPVVEMASKSKLSSICWNGYIKSQIASSNFEGVVQVWDVTRSQVFKEMKEHERRVWSVDYSPADPTLLASGSDDGSVKLWNINQGVSVGTIKTKANVCCVQFPTDTSNCLAFGSADHKIYYYDLRSSKMPLCTLIGHKKTVSYVKFLDSATLVSASTDNTLKLWDLSTCTSPILDSPVQSFTGHTNMKNFVGLSVSDGYIATGSETNEVFIYHKAFPMPSLSYKFNITDPHCYEEADGGAQFISSVCWRGQSTTLVAANSMGNIKLLEMV